MTGCGNHSCIFVKPKGQGTNSNCSCLSSLDTGKRIFIEKLMHNEKVYKKRIEELEAELGRKCLLN